MTTPLSHIVINCMVPNESPERFADIIENICNILEERTVIYNLKVIDSVTLAQEPDVHADEGMYDRVRGQSQAPDLKAN